MGIENQVEHVKKDEKFRLDEIDSVTVRLDNFEIDEVPDVPLEVPDVPLLDQQEIPLILEIRDRTTMLTLPC